jgi:hypothetical protein
MTPDYDLRECKKCLLLASGDFENYKLVKEYIQKIPENEKSEDKLYSNRLEKCKNCSFLISGTCLKCGCYVEFRAAFKKKHCPKKIW